MPKYSLKTLFFALTLFVATSANAQTAKQIEKATKTFYKDYDKGIAKLRKYMLKTDEPSLAAYEVLVKMEFLKYDQSMAIWDGIKFEVDDPDGETNDSILKAYIEEFKLERKNYFLDVCRQATLESYSQTADMYLRIMLIDTNPDSLVGEEALKYFSKGEEYFSSKQYEKAEDEYRKALEEAPGFYKATLYIGDSFWVREQPDSALYYYELAKEMHPNLLEPRKYIIDALMDMGLFYRAKKECLEAFCVYPGIDMKIKFQKILEVENKWLNDQRFTRDFYPNNYRRDDQSDLSRVWLDYRKAKKEISRYCNEDGIIEENGITKDKYLEVYSFRKMLDENVDKDLPSYLNFALKMKEEGYLEPYIFISMFHIDIYPQFKHYMSEEGNREKAIDFIEKYLIVKIED